MNFDWEKRADGWIRDNETWVTYGDFGRDTYGLHCELDGARHVACIHAEDDFSKGLERADSLLAKIENDGFRAVNW
jgi:hypothetical protein